MRKGSNQHAMLDTDPDTCACCCDAHLCTLSCQSCAVHAGDKGAPCSALLVMDVLLICHSEASSRVFTAHSVAGRLKWASTRAPSMLYCPTFGSTNCTMYPAGLCKAAASTCKDSKPNEHHGGQHAAALELMAKGLQVWGIQSC